MNKKLKIILLAVLLTILIGGVIRLYFRMTNDFRLGTITHDIPYRKEWDPPPLSVEKRLELDSILSQTFNYMGKGVQSYVFVSNDGKHVLKFFKYRHLTPNRLLYLLPPFPPFQEYKNHRIQQKNQALANLFEGYRLAYAEHKNESGLVYIHLNLTHNIYPTITVYDKIGLKWRIPLDDVVFIIQERAQTLRTVLHNALKTGDTHLAEKKINCIFDLYLTEYNKGIYDKDHGVLHNTGFVGDKPIHLDVGELTSDEKIRNPEIWRHDLEKIAWKMAVWLKKEHASYYPLLSKSIETTLTALMDQPFEFALRIPPQTRKQLKRR